MTLIVASATLSFALSAALTYLLCGAGRSFLNLDIPNERSLHARPVPRGAGLAILATTLVVGVTLLFFEGAPPAIRWVVLGGAAIAVVSWLDDRRHVSPAWRLAVHLVAGAVFVVGSAFDLGPPNAGPVVSAGGALAAAGLVIGIAWITNLYNFMDGMDGFAGGMTLIGFGTFGVLAWLNHDPQFTLICVVLAGAAAGFLVFNLPPARIFLGDVGSSTLGYGVATLSLLAVWQGTLALPAVLLVFSPFVIDASVTLIRRLLAGHKVWEAHRTHFYQRLVSAGWSTRRTLLAEYAVMIACSATAVVVEWWHLQWVVVLAAWACVYAGLIAAVVHVERVQQRQRPTRAFQSRSSP